MNFKEKKQALLNQAYDLKFFISLLIEDYGEPPFDINGTIDLLLDEIASLEHDEPEGQ